LRRSIKLILLMLCSVGLVYSSGLFSGTALGKEKISDEILAMGFAKVVQGNMAAAKSEALTNAMRKAMEEYLILRLGEAGVINDFERVVREVLPAVNEAIENFHILAENTGGDAYQVLVKVKINKKVIDEKLRFSGIALEQASRSKTLFMVSEVKGERTQYWWKGPDFFSLMNQTEVLLFNAFQERGFMPINHTFGVAEGSLSPEMRREELDHTGALEWGKMLSADFVITGKSVIEDGKSVTLQLRVLSVKDGLLLTEGSETGRKDMIKGSDERSSALLERVVRKLANRLIPSMLSLGSESAAGVQHIQITLKGMRNYQEFKDVEQFLKEDLPGVQSVRQSRMSRGLLSVEVDFTGSREQLLHHILNQEKLPVKLVLENATDTEIILQVAQ